MKNIISIILISLVISYLIYYSLNQFSNIQPNNLKILTIIVYNMVGTYLLHKKKYFISYISLQIISLFIVNFVLIFSILMGLSQNAQILMVLLLPFLILNF